MNLGGLRIHVVAAFAVLVGQACSGGGGCGGCGTTETIPGGFPAAKRSNNAVQLRVTPTGFAQITKDPAALVGSLLGGGGLSFNVPGSCSGDPAICCDANNQPLAACGPLDIDLSTHADDVGNRLELAPQQGKGELLVTMRARLKTEMDLPLSIFGQSCGVKIDTVPGSNKDVEIILPLDFAQDATSGTTRINVGTLTINRLEDSDFTLNGGFFCTIGQFGLSFFIDTLKSTFADQIKGTIQDQLCKQCPTGDVAECGPFASACTNNVCQEGGQCLQELGLDGRMRGNSVFGSLSPGTTGALDLYEVLGGYATSNNNGLSFGLLGGMQPGGAPRDRCGPPGTDPGNATVPQSAFFQGNVRPDNNQPFDVAIGLHKSQLAQFGYAGYDGGFLCLTITGNTISQLNTDTFSALSRSLGKLVETNSAMAVGLRPQSQPAITLGRNVFTDDGMGGKTLTEPLLDINFTGMEIDFFASVDDQFIRIFTIVADVHLPVGLQTTGMGQLQPVIGNPDDAFTNISVKNSDALTESPTDLANLFPALLQIALPQLSNGLSPVSLPQIGNLQLQVSDVTAVDQVSFLAIFANLVPAMGPRPVHPTATVGAITEAPPAVLKDPKQWKRSAQPTIQLELGGDRPGLEYSYRLDKTTWTAWSTNTHPTVRSQVLWLSGTHTIEVRAREVDKPWTIATVPAIVDVELGAIKPRVAPFHGQPSGAGCQCNAGGSPMTALPFALILGLLMIPRRIRKRLQRLGAITWLAALACLPGCSCSSNPCGDSKCIAGDLDHGGLGRWTSIGADDSRVVAATYDLGLGDLVAADVTDPNNVTLVAVDGIPTDVKPTHDPKSYRGGVEDPGPNVGAWTSTAVAGGLARISYQDRDAHALKFAIETKPGKWTTMVVDEPGDPTTQEVGRYTSLVLDGNGLPAIAYIALGNDDGAGHRNTELRIARSSQSIPNTGTWTTTMIASGIGSCAGLCGGGEACIAADMGPTCTATTADCSATCDSSQACITGTCTDVLGDAIETVASGAGMFAHMVALADGRLAIVYYDSNAKGLKIAVESGAGTSQFMSMDLDVGAADRGYWASAAVDSAGTVHVAYQDMISDTLMYTTWNGTPGTPELVDDGTRTGDRTHNVGQATAIFLVGGAPQIAYQDGLTSDVYIATKAGSTWSTTGLAMGPLLDGFSIAVTTAHGGTPYLAWDRLDQAQSPPNTLFVQTH
jgi:hypothetical protein